MNDVHFRVNKTFLKGAREGVDTMMTTPLTSSVDNYIAIIEVLI